MSRSDADLLSRAIVLWTRWDDSNRPRRDDERLIEEFGNELGPRLVTEVQALVADYFSSSAKWTARDLGEMGEQASAEFRARHPEVSTEAVEALAWSYTFAYR